MTTSENYFEQAQKVTPGGVHSPVRAFRHVGRAPIFFEKAEGPYLYDVDGNRYIDFCLSFGPHILGHSNPFVVNAIQMQAEKATSFGACHLRELELVRWILKGYPFFERVRLVNSGTEAVMTAIRIARGYTGRDKILKFEGCYHGHSDALLTKAGSGLADLAEASSQGVPQSAVADTLCARLDNFQTVRELFRKFPDKIAAILLEPIPANYGLWIPKRDTLDAIVRLARKHNTLVIFDEVISGFRLGKAGACEYWDINPDIVTLGKVIGGGLPLAAIAGKAEILDQLAPLGSVYQAGTLSGNPLATTAGCAVLEQLFTHPPFEHLARLTQEFATALEASLQPFGAPTVRHLGSLFWINFSPESDSFPSVISSDSLKQFSRFYLHALKNGLYFSPSPYEVGFLSVAHSSSCLEEVIDRICRK